MRDIIKAEKKEAGEEECIVLHIRSLGARDSLGCKGIVVLPGSQDDARLEEPLSEWEQDAKRKGWVWRALAGQPADIAVQGVEEVPSRIGPVTTRGMRDRQEEVVPHDPVGGAAMEEPRGGLGPAPRGDGLPDLVQSGQPAEVDRDDRVPGELPLGEERRGASPELDPPAFGDPMEDQIRMKP